MTTMFKGAERLLFNRVFRKEMSSGEIIVHVQSVEVHKMVSLQWCETLANRCIH